MFKVDSIAGHVELYMWLVDPCSTWQYIMTTDNLCKNTLVWKQIQLGSIWRNLCPMFALACISWTSWVVDLGLYGQIFHLKVGLKSVHASSVKSVLGRPSRIMSTFSTCPPCKTWKNKHIHTSLPLLEDVFLYVPYFPIFLPPWLFSMVFACPKGRVFFQKIPKAERLHLGCTTGWQRYPSSAASTTAPWLKEVCR